jgi:hypothetical protein
MAIEKKGIVTQKWLMSNTNPKTKRQKVASVTNYVTAASVTAYNAAADDAARAATALGVLFSTRDALSIGVPLGVDVGFAYVDNAAIPPTSNEFVFPFDKFGISFRADGENYVSSIPARNDTNVVMSGDGVTVNLGTGASSESTDFVAAFNTVVLSEESAAVTITQMTIPS